MLVADCVAFAALLVADCALFAALFAVWSAAAAPVAAAPVAAVPAAAPMLPAACWAVQVSEIELTEVACREPSDACVPVISTWCASFGFNVLLSPLTLTVWPLSVARVQFPPDCFRQPRIVLGWLELELEVVLVVVVLWVD